MAKIKKPVEDCEYVIYPLGKGLPLCIYKPATEKTLDGVKLRDLPICKYKNHCFKAEDEKRRKQGGETNNSD